MDHSPRNHPLNVVQDAAQEAPNGAALGTLAKSVDTKNKNRRQRFSLQRQAAKILGRERVGKCLWSIADLSSQVRILKRDDRARFDGLQTCGSVWHCPVCSHKVSETRRRELNDALSAARARGWGVFLITLTFSHSSADSLTDNLEALKDAKKHFHQSRPYKNHKQALKGSITATEVTHGANGWHPHYHVLQFIDGTDLTIMAVAQMMESLGEQWVKSLEKMGLKGTQRFAFQWQDGNAAGQYVAKWGAAEELTLSKHKEGKGKTPFQLLEDAQHNPASRALFYEYGQAFKGKRQLFWSHGLKEALGITVETDEEAAKTDPDNQDEWLFSYARDQWNQARKQGRANILEAAERGKDTGLEVIE